MKRYDPPARRPSLRISDHGLQPAFLGAYILAEHCQGLRDTHSGAPEPENQQAPGTGRGGRNDAPDLVGGEVVGFSTDSLH